MKRKQIYLTDQLDRELSELAKFRGVPQSEVIREGLEKYLASLENKEKEWEELIQQMKTSAYGGMSWTRDDLYDRNSLDEK